MSAQSVFSQKGMMQGTTVAYMAMSLRGNQPPPLLTIGEGGLDDHGAMSGPQVLNLVKLAVVYDEPTISLLHHTCC